MPLPLGNWKINVNGKESILNISSVDQSGVLILAFQGAPNFGGFWDEVSQTITFSYASTSQGQPTIGIFKGYLFRSPSDAVEGQDLTATLTGFLQTNEGTIQTGFIPIGSSRRNIFGWMAQINEVK